MQGYVRFTEDNEWEGERWRFYIPLDDNVDAISELSGALEALYALEEDDGDQAFTLSAEVFTEAEVDAAIKLTDDDSGYMAPHTNLEGKLTIPESLTFEMFYKGGIRDLLVKEG